MPTQPTPPTRTAQLAVLSTPAPTPVAAKHRQAAKQRQASKPQKIPQESPTTPTAPQPVEEPPPDLTVVEELMIEAGVPGSLAGRLNQRCITVRQAQQALRHWDGLCCLTGLALSDTQEMLMPVERADGTFVCRAAQELQGDLSDGMLVKMCQLIVDRATMQRQQINPTTQRPQPAQNLEHHHEQVAGLELRDNSVGVEGDHWPFDGPGPAELGHGQRGGLGRSVEDFLRWAEGPAVPAGR